MLLAIDVGNTQTVIGAYDGERLAHSWRVATVKGQTGDEIRTTLSMLFLADGFDVSAVDGAVLSSVVPRLTGAWERALERMLGVQVLVCSAATAGDLFPANYGNPAEVGADRVADFIGARMRYGAPCVVVDFGTATNIELVDREGRFAGGIIAPGVETSANALFSLASKLTGTELVAPELPLGQSTDQAVRSGIVMGEADRVDGLVRRIFEQVGYTAPVVATGGLAGVIAPLSSCITEVNPDLTLEGLRALYEHKMA
ncbi:MAG: type III pantothenate kinase [Coriobacteriia bacterium]|nr:type III pantothenate kinase [Coriobacteriia bacterium]